MAEQFYSILTSIGKAKIANASVFGTKLNLTTLALGDGNGKYYNPTENQEALVNEVWRGNVGAIATNSENSNWIVMETMIAGNVGGFFIRELGVLDDEGSLIAIGKYPETYKPIVSDGATKDLIIRMILEVDNASSVTLKIDPTTVIATKKDIEILDNKIKNIDIPVHSVNGRTGSIELKAEDIKTGSGNTVESQIVDMKYKKAGGTATEITVTAPSLVDGYSKTFIVSENNNGTSTTINGKPLYKPNTTASPNLIAGKAVTVWYSSTNKCFFIKASAEGNAEVANVLAGKTFSNDNDTEIIGAMPNRGSLSQTLTTQGGQYNLPSGYYSGGYVKAQFPNLVSENIKKGINIGGVVGNFEEITVFTHDQIINYSSDEITVDIPYKPKTIIASLPYWGLLIFWELGKILTVKDGFSSKINTGCVYVRSLFSDESNPRYKYKSGDAFTFLSNNKMNVNLKEVSSFGGSTYDADKRLTFVFIK